MYNGYNFQYVNDRFGNSNSAIRFTDGYYQIPPGVYFKGDFTISIWLKINVFLPYSTIIEFFNAPNLDSVTIQSANSQLQPQLFISYSYSYNSITSPIIFLRGQWTHLVVSLSGTTGSVYLNGMLAAQSNYMSIPRNIKRTSNSIGKDSSSYYDNLWSDLDDLRIYDRALSQTEIYDLLYCSSVTNSTNYIFNATTKPSIINQTSNFKYFRFF